MLRQVEAVPQRSGCKVQGGIASQSLPSSEVCPASQVHVCSPGPVERHSELSLHTGGLFRQLSTGWQFLPVSEAKPAWQLQENRNGR